VQEEQKQEAAPEKKEEVRPPYTGDKGYWEAKLARDTPVETKTVATYSHGARVRIAALQTD
jgi:hypothetical protein